MTNKSYRRIIRCGEQLISLDIIRQRRKTMALHVYPGSAPVELKVPLKCPWVEIDAFLASREAWIIRSISELANEPQEPEITYQNGELHYFLGDAYPLIITRGRGKVWLDRGRFNVRCSKPNDKSVVKALLEKFYKTECRSVFELRVAKCVQKFPVKVQPGDLRVRKMKSRWGSCSREGELCLNTILVRQPILSIDYVIMHELCHLRHFHHNQEFYGLLDQAMPNWRTLEESLGKVLKQPHQLSLF